MLQEEDLAKEKEVGVCHTWATLARPCQAPEKMSAPFLPLWGGGGGPWVLSTLSEAHGCVRHMCSAGGSQVWHRADLESGGEFTLQTHAVWVPEGR